MGAVPCGPYFAEGMKCRPPVTIPPLRLAAPFLFFIFLGVAQGPAAALAIAIFAMLVIIAFAVLWLVAPYSQRVWRFLEPPGDRRERLARMKERRRRIPIYGRIYRLGEKITGGAEERLLDEWEHERANKRK